MLLSLDMKGIAVSSGSACSSKSLKASHVLLAMGLDHAAAQGSIVFSLLEDTTAADIEYVLDVFPPIIDRLRKMSPALHRVSQGEPPMIYSDKVMDHFSNPRNVGTIADADGVGQVGNPVCGDMMTFYIKVKDDRLADIKFQTFGCGAAIAVSSMVSEMAMGKTLDEAMAITNEKVAEELGGLPKNKMHCSNLGADALHLAIENYEAIGRPGPRPWPPAAVGRPRPRRATERGVRLPLLRRAGRGDGGRSAPASTATSSSSNAPPAATTPTRPKPPAPIAGPSPGLSAR